MHDKRWSLALHGGAGTMAPDRMTEAQQADYQASLAAALDRGAEVLAAGGTALDAVETVVSFLEDDPKFNAGRGAVFTYDDRNELDASIMDGRDRSAGAVTGVTRVRNPVRLARAVMEHSPHVFLSGEGAEAFAQERGIEMVDPDWFATPERRRQLDEFKARKVGWFDADLKYGTVGAVALDGVRVTSIRATIGRELMALGLQAGLGWDRASAHGSLRAAGAGGSLPFDGFTAQRALFHGGVTATWLVTQFHGELAYASGYEARSEGSGGGRYDPTAGSLLATLTFRILF